MVIILEYCRARCFDTKLKGLQAHSPVSHHTHGSQKVPGIPLIKKSATTDSIWSKNDHRGIVTRSWRLSRIHSCDFVRRFEDETCQCEVCSEWFLHHDDALSHTSLVVQQFLAEKKHSCHHPTTVLSGSRYKWLSVVPYSENGPQGDAFRTMEDIESGATAELRKIPKEAFHQWIQKWQDRWSKCVCARKGPTLKVIR